MTIYFCTNQSASEEIFIDSPGGDRQHGDEDEAHVERGVPGALIDGGLGDTASPDVAEEGPEVILLPDGEPLLDGSDDLDLLFLLLMAALLLLQDALDVLVQQLRV